MSEELLPPIHPGEILLEEFLEPMNISQCCMMTPVTALLLIDAQQGLLDGEAAIPDAAVVIDRLVKVLAAARSAGTLIIHLQNDGALGTLS